mgnify:CR=1 FL=1
MKATILSNGTVNDVDFLISYIKNTDLFICAYKQIGILNISKRLVLRYSDTR